MSVSTDPGSTAFVMSCSVSPAIATAVSASISTPVCAVVEALAVMVMRSSANSKSTFTEVNGSGWHSGISSLVRLAPWMPAMRAVASTSALGRSSARTSAMTSRVDTKVPAAVAVRFVIGFGRDIHHAGAPVGVEVA